MERDVRLLFLTRFTRLFAYGSLSVVLVLYLSALSLTLSQIGVLLTLTLVGDTLVSLWLTTRADRIGRRRVLVIGAVLMAAAGAAFAATRNLALLLIAGKDMGLFSQVGDTAIIFGFAGLCGVVGFGLIWIWMIAVHAQLVRTAK